jgi:hypothetical protein
MFDLPPGAERTVQYADYLGPRTSFVLVTIPSEVSRGVVARSVAALSKGPNRVLGYVENMSGYYCRDCNGIKPLFESSEDSPLEIPCLGTVPFDPELARQCDRGIPLAELPESPVGVALDHVAQQLLDSLDSNPGATHEISLRPLRQPDETSDHRSARTRLALGRLRVSRVRLRDGDAHQRLRDTGRPVARGADRSRHEPGRRRAPRRREQMPLHRDDPFDGGGATFLTADSMPVQWTAAAEARLANIPEFVRPMAKTGIEKFARDRGSLEVDETILDAAKDFFGM